MSTPRDDEGIREIGRTTVRHGRKFDFEVVSVAMPGGRTLQVDLVRHGGAAVILPVLEAAGGKSVVFVRNHRYSIGRPLLEIPAGTLEKGEQPIVCAGRELIEETGYRAANIEPLVEFLPSPGMSDERMYTFLATGLTHVGQDLEEDESIEVEIVPAADAIAMASDGRLEDGKSILAVLLAARLGRL
ncbi:MAG: NUDIX hydrolase [Phycisphaeraceae bacterium]|nr:NUDIX hydrolase [Phycisphaeraceae bacterium]